MKEIVTSVFIFALLAAAVFYGGWAGAFVITHIWKWYLIPAFDLAPLKMIHAFGISLLTHFCTHHPSLNVKDDKLEPTERLAKVGGVLLYPWIVFFLAWAGKVFFM